MKEARSQALVAWLAQFVRDASTDDQIERFVTQVDDLILRQNPQIAEDPMLVLDLHNSTRTQWRAFLVTLVEPEHRLMLPESATELARSVARRGLELGVLLKVYRAGQQALFGYLTDLTEGLQPGDPGRDRVLVDIWNRADRWLDGGIERLIAVYYEERQRLHGGCRGDGQSLCGPGLLLTVPGIRSHLSPGYRPRAGPRFVYLAIVLYQDVELLCLTSGNRNLTTRMAQRELKALARADKNTVLIRDTVLAYFESGLNVEATAQRLYMHKNTIRYRLARAEELVGHSLSERTAHLELALRYVSMFGSL